MALKIEEYYQNNRGIGFSQNLIENSCCEWNEYLTISSVLYQFQGKRSLLLIGLESETDTKRIWRSFTRPEITLVETINPQNDIIESHFEVCGITQMNYPTLGAEMHAIGKIGVTEYFSGQMNCAETEALESLIIKENDLSDLKLESMVSSNLIDTGSLEQNLQMATKLTFKENSILENWKKEVQTDASQDNIEKFKEQFSIQTQNDLFPSVSIKDENGNIHTYDRLYRLFYQTEDKRTAVLYMVPKATKYQSDFLGNEGLNVAEQTYQSITNPEISYVQKWGICKVIEEKIVSEYAKSMENVTFNDKTDMILQPCLGVEEISYDTIVQLQEAFYQMCNGRLVEDINGDWSHYKETTCVEIQNEETKEKSFLLMGLISRDENKSVYRSYTMPEITLIATQNKSNYSTEYKLQTKMFTPTKRNEDFTLNNTVLSAVSLMGSGKLSYNDVFSYETNLNQSLEESSERSFGR